MLIPRRLQDTNAASGYRAWARRICGRNPELDPERVDERKPAAHRSVDRRRRRSVPAIWGDGFEDDGLREAAIVSDLLRCSPDEYIRVFPAVVAGAASAPPELTAHLVTCVAVRAWRLGKGSESEPLRSIRVSDVLTLGPLGHDAWFPASDSPSPSDVATEHCLLNFTDRVLWQVRNGVVAPYEESVASLFAFATGIHPVYLWREALISHELHTAVGWLGFLNRGRLAYMPIDIAEYLVDAIVSVGRRRSRFCDGRIAPFLDDEKTIDHIRSVAMRRLEGRKVATDRLPPSRAPRLGPQFLPVS